VAQNLTEDPFPPLLLGRLEVAPLLRDLRLPPVRIVQGRAVPEPMVDPPAAAAGRQRVVAAMQDGLKRAVWEKLTHTKEYQDFAMGAIAFAEARYRDAADVLAGLGTEPILRSEAATLRGVSAYLAGEPEAAITAFTVAIVRKDDKDRNRLQKEHRAWPAAFFSRGAAHAAVAALRVAAGTDAAEATAAAVADFEQAAAGFTAARRPVDAHLALDRAIAVVPPGSPEALRLTAARDALPQ
jgi:hypothetical protein